MSDELIKNNHSKRLLQKNNYIKKQLKIARAHGMEIKRGQEHRLQDHAALNCGRPSCMLCSNPRRVWKEKTIKEKSFEQTKNWME